jgi:tetratricopeptide (TPR) repeat protein
MHHRFNKICLESGYDNDIGLTNQASELNVSGAIRESEAATRRALIVEHKNDRRFLEAITLYSIGLVLATRGLTQESEVAFHRSLRIFGSQYNDQGKGLVTSHVARKTLWVGEFATALSLANQAWKLAHVLNLERDFIRAARMQGEAAAGLNNFATADERLHHALTRARMVNLAEEEIPALVALAELRRQQGEEKAAREFLDDVWESVERGPYPLFHADACNVLAQIERDAGNVVAAVKAATKAYRLAWCDGPPFAYHWGLEKARKHLRELGASEPEMPPFDESKFEPMPEVEIDPEDEFHAGKSPDA